MTGRVIQPDGLIHWTVLYRSSESLLGDPPEAFRCWAENTEHAEEQCRNFLPDCDIVWTYPGEPDAAYQDYWGNTEPTQ